MTVARDKDILERAHARDEAAAVRRLIAAVEQSAAADGGMTPETKRWLERAGAVAASLDPLAGGLGPMLASHESLAEEAGAPPQQKRWGY